MARIKISNQELYYAARGESGAPLVFVHGAGDSHLLWNGQLAALSDAARTFGIDLPGHGRSTGPGRSTVLDYAVTVREFLDALDLNKVALVGASMGGAIAQTVALEFPERLRGLVLVGTGAKLRVAPQYLNGLQESFPETVRTLVENYYAPDAPPSLKEKSFQQLAATGATVTHDDYAACDAFDGRERVKDISLPTLVLCGRQDRMTPPKFSEYLAQQIPNAELVLVENAGHMVMLEQPGAVNAAIRKWLKHSLPR